MSNAEMITAFLPNFLFLTGIFTLFNSSFLIKHYLEDIPKSTTKGDKPFPWKGLIVIFLVIVLFFNLWVYFFNWYNEPNKSADFSTRIIINYIACLGWLITGVFTIILYYPNINSDSKKENSRWLSVLYLTGCMFFYSLSMNYHEVRNMEARAIKIFGNDFAASFLYKGKLFKTDSTTFFIGDTKDFLFFYNKKTDNTLILERKNIDSLSIKN